MKRYIITKKQFEDIQALTRWLCFGKCSVTDRAIPSSASIVEMLDSLNPIEPLDNPTIKSIMVANGFKTYPEVGDDLKPYCYAAVRAIESHILGEES